MPGAGKTLLAEIAFLSVPLKSGEEKRKLLYLVPYRALLNEKYIYFLNRFNRSCYRIYRSSSDYFDNDENIIGANCDIAIMIYEKLDNALRCLPNSSNLFYDYDLIVMDEFSLISSLDRGIVINSILKRYESLSEWHENKRKARVLALTVPECRTSEYNQQGFLTMMNDSRPVDIYEAIIQADRGIVIPKNIDMEWPISYEKLNNIVLTNHMDEKRQKRDEINDMDEFEYYESKELLPYLIKAHRKRNHHIIIFCSSRENVRNLSNSISKMIFKNKIPHGDWSERLISIQRNMGDNSYGCIDDKMILSAKYGVTYHNSDLPIELRREIEKEFCKIRNSRLDIVVSTETLAYGINCSADVVIVYERIKPTTEEDYPNFQYGSGGYMRYLNSVEYQNFIGRAGRLGYGEDGSQHCGYAYLFSKNCYGSKKVRASYYADSGKRFHSSKQLFAMKLRRNPLIVTMIVFDEIQINKQQKFSYENLMQALTFLMGKRKIRNEDAVVGKLVKEMRRLQLIEDESENGYFILTRVGKAIHGTRIPYEALCGMRKIIDTTMKKNFSRFFLIFQICEIVHNINLGYLNRKMTYLFEFGENISRFFDELESKWVIDGEYLQKLRKFEKSINDNIRALEPNEKGYTYLSEKLSAELHQFQNAAILYLWTEGCSIEKINKKYKFPARLGTINNFSRNVAHILDCLIKISNSYMDANTYTQQIQEVRLMVKYGMPYCCIESLNFQFEMSIRPEICELIEMKGKETTAEILKKLSLFNKINDNSSLSEINGLRKILKQTIEEA